MRFSTRLMLLGLMMVNGMTVASADVVVDGQVIESADISQISIDPVSGDINISAGGLYTVTKDSDPPPGPNVVINSLTASSTVVVVGQAITISWSTTAADTCTPSGGSGGWDSEPISLPSGTSSSLTMSAVGSFSFRLDCSNDTPSQTFRTVTVQVNDEVDPPEPNNCPDPTLFGELAQWEDVFTSSWPDPRSGEPLTTIPRAGYLAIEFNTGSVVEDGGVSTVEHTSTSGARYIAISKCPGIFTADQLPDTLSRCTESMILGGQVKWNTLAGSQRGECNLEPGTTYYLNVTFTDGENASTDQCLSTSGGCRTKIKVWY